MKRLLRLFLLIGLLLPLLVAGCGPRSVLREATITDQGARGSAPAAAPMRVQAPEEGAPGPALWAFAFDAERKIILTANLQLVVKETENTVAAIKGLVAAQGGYVASANIWRLDNLLQAQLTVHVPADKMDWFLAEVKKLAVRVEREESGGQDVTEEYVDLGAQLRNLEATETELRALLTDVREKSGKAEDVMAVYRELVNVRGEIERIKGRMQYLDRSAELATVNLSLSERQLEPIGRPGWQPLQTVRRALSSLVQVAKFSVDAAIWVVLLGVPLLGLPVAVAWLLWRLTRQRRALRAKARAFDEERRRTEA